MAQSKPLPKIKKEMNLDQWYKLAAEWHALKKGKRSSLSHFLFGYIQGLNLERDPAKFLLRQYSAPSFAGYLNRKLSSVVAKDYCTKVHDFIAWVLKERFSAANSDGYKLILPQYHNPVSRIKKKKGLKIDDPEFTYFLQIDSTLDQWGSLATEWCLVHNRKTGMYLTLFNLFLFEYIHGLNLERDPAKFLLKSYSAPSFMDYLDRKLSPRKRRDYCSKIYDFIEWVLRTKFSDPDEKGRQIISALYHNPVQRLRRKIMNKINDPDFNYFVRIDPTLDQWRALAATCRQGDGAISNGARAPLDHFILRYIHGLNLERDPSKFLLKSYLAPSFSDCLSSDAFGKRAQKEYINFIHDFLNRVLRERFSEINERGIRFISAQFHNPVPHNRKTRRAYLPKGMNFDFKYVLHTDPSLEDWRALAAEWVKGEPRARHLKHNALEKFLLDYIHGKNLERYPKDFLRRSYRPPPFWECSAFNLKYSTALINVIHKFFAWVLSEKLSIEEGGRKFVPSEFQNPFSKKSAGYSPTPSESVRTPLPYRMIRELREMLCHGLDFREWLYAHEKMECGTIAGDWFEIDRGKIDETDSDCVWRERACTKFERRKRGSDGVIHEIWSPVRSVALYVILHLPLRQFQVRMLDSGEADTWRYENTGWRLNHYPLRTGDEKRSFQRGVFHRSVDLKTRKTMTGFYINTNKTADIDKEELAKGYTIPWQNEEVLFWLEKLRNWQQKYNPITKPIAWKELEQKHFGFTPQIDHILERKGTVCFLFRHAAASAINDRSKPLPTGAVSLLWLRLLTELEKRCEMRGETLDDGTKIRFVEGAPSQGTHYPVHSLRVSLITAYTLEGGVPFPILSKLVVGHARLIMTLYYAKAGKAHVTQVMEEGEKKLLESEQGSYRRFFINASYKQVEESFACNDPESIFAACQSKSAGSLVVEDKGICTVGGGRCNVGGDPITNNMNPKNTVYAPVPGYPIEKTCVRCRFFVTGPAFLPGLVAHFNSVSYQLSESSNRYVRFEKQVNDLEDDLHKCEEQGYLFTKASDLNRANHFYEEEAEKADKLANDLHATLRLIDRCKTLLRESSGDGIKLVPIGGVTDIQYALEEIHSEMQQLEVICENAVLFPEINASKATLRRSQILDAMMELNGRPPIFFKLDEGQQLLVGNELMKLIRARAGSFKDAVVFAEGKRILTEIGLLDNVDSLLEQKTNGIAFSKVINLHPTLPALNHRKMEETSP